MGVSQLIRTLNDAFGAILHLESVVKAVKSETLLLESKPSEAKADRCAVLNDSLQAQDIITEERNTVLSDNVQLKNSLSACNNRISSVVEENYFLQVSLSEKNSFPLSLSTI